MIVSSLPVDGLPEVELLLEAGGIGAWHLDPTTSSLRWSALTRRLHEVGPDFIPTLEAALSFYPGTARAKLEQAIETARRDGLGWDLELPFVTARGRRLWVRARGLARRRADGRAILAGSIEDITDTRRKAREHERLALVVSQMTNAAIVTDRAGRTVWVNAAFTRLTGYSAAELKGRKPGSVLQGPETDRAEVSRISAAIRDARPIEAEILNYRKNGQPYWITMTITPVREPGGAVSGFIAIESDITDRRRAEAAAAAETRRRAEAEALLRDVIDSLPSAVIAYDAADRVLLSNRAYLDMYPGLHDQVAPGTPMCQLLETGVARGVYRQQVTPDAPAEEREAWVSSTIAAITAAGPSRVFPTHDGRWIQGRERRSPTGTLVCIRTDITRLKVAEERSRRQAEEDPLTGLANRTLLFSRLARLLNGRRARDEAGCLVTFDLDHFKAVNDSLGHEAGDLLLRKVARRIRSVARTSDTAARLGGDEFALILPGLVTAADAEAFLARLVSAVCRPARILGRSVTPSLSLGAAFFPSDARSAEALYRSADAALFEAKRQGRGRWAFFDRRIDETLRRRVSLAEALRAALAGEGLSIALQPQRRLSDGAHVGFEALARWRLSGEAVPPSEFIPVAEETGLIIPLGTAVMRAALVAMRRMLDQGLEPGRVAVNVASAQLLAPDFAETVAGLCREAGVGPERLEIEVTETVLLDRSAGRISAVLAALRRLGVEIALDDFGTGYASLTHLQRFPVQRLKIDRSFVAALETVGRDAQIARTVISLAHGLGLEAVAEGIETAAQHDYLAAQGCEIGQGHFISPPLAPEEAAAHLAGSEAARRPRRRKLRLVAG